MNKNNKTCPDCGVEMSLIHSPYIGNCTKKYSKIKSLLLEVTEVQNN